MSKDQKNLTQPPLVPCIGTKNWSKKYQNEWKFGKKGFVTWDYETLYCAALRCAALRISRGALLLRGRCGCQRFYVAVGTFHGIILSHD